MTARESSKVRYAVVGLGYIAQAAVLPAFEVSAMSSKSSAAPFLGLTKASTFDL